MMAMQREDDGRSHSSLYFYIGPLPHAAPAVCPKERPCVTPHHPPYPSHARAGPLPRHRPCVVQSLGLTWPARRHAEPQSRHHKQHEPVGIL